MQAGEGRPSYDELAALVAEQARVIAELRARVAGLEAENAELKRRLGMDSTNSSKPPSSDSPFTKPAPKSLRRRSGRKPGGQPGHPGSALALVADPNERKRHEPGRCTGCGQDLADAPEVGMERRQVFDLPPMTVRVTEHQLIARCCGCGTTTCGTAPQGVSAPVQYGPPRSCSTSTSDSSCPRSAPARRWPICSAPRSRMPPWPPWPPAPRTGSTGSSPRSKIGSPPP